MKLTKYRLTCISLKSGRSAWYYVERGVKNPTKKATGVFGKRNRAEAEAVVRALEEKASFTNQTFRQYSDPFFTAACPHLLKLEGEGRHAGPTYVRKSRQLLERAVFTDRLAGMPIAEIKRGDLVEFRARLLKTLRHDSGEPKYRTIRQVDEIVKVIFKEAYYREDLDRDPTAGIGKLKYAQAERGVFTLEELRRLFPESGLGPWRSWTAHTLFLLAWQTGMRAGELRALTWDQIDQTRKRIRVDRAFKGGGREIGLPKGEKTRVTFVTDRVLRAMDKLKAETLMELVKWQRTGSEYVFVNPHTGIPYSEPWAVLQFRAGLEISGIDEQERHRRVLVPHSLRHTCNSILRDSGADDFKRRLALWGLKSSEIEDRYTNIDAVDLGSLSSIMERV